MSLNQSQVHLRTARLGGADPTPQIPQEGQDLLLLGQFCCGLSLQRNRLHLDGL